MLIAITFAHLNDTGSHACEYWENLLHVVVLVLEFKANINPPLME